MYIKGIKLKNFRNYSELEIDLSKNVNVFIGDNAQGKTNILESVYFCSLGKSHRTSKDKELIKWDEPIGELLIDVGKAGLDKSINIRLSKDGKKTVLINKVKIKKMSELIGVFNAVMFSPEDLKIVKESPSYRRRFLDIEISKLSPKYYRALVNYNKVLNERNTILKKSFGGSLDVIDIYDRQLSQLGAYIIRQRKNYLSKLQEYGYELHKEITRDKEDICFEYISCVKDIESAEQELYSQLCASRSLDLQKRSTSKGPHRDDFSIYINGIDARNYGSQGQQRTSILTIKFASLEIIKNVIGEYPVLLLDDVLSELDNYRQKFILQSLKGVQTIITCTGIDSIRENLKDDFKLFEVDDGSIKNIIQE